MAALVVCVVEVVVCVGVVVVVGVVVCIVVDVVRRCRASALWSAS